MCVPLAAEAQAERKDGSHPVHVDNCILNAEALVCIKEPPAYTFRDFRCQWSSGPQGPVPCSLLQHMHAWDQLFPESRTLWVGNQTVWEWLQCSGRTEWREEDVMQKQPREGHGVCSGLRVGRREGQESCS